MGILELSQGITAVDVGCGSGFLTRLIARGLKGRGRIIGVDIDEKLLHAAQEIATKKIYISFESSSFWSRRKSRVSCVQKFCVI